MSTVTILYLLILAVSVIYGFCLWVLCDWIIALRRANEAMDHDLNEAEERLGEHYQLIQELEEIRIKLEAIPSKNDLLTTQRLPAYESGDDVVYATRT